MYFNQFQVSFSHFAFPHFSTDKKRKVGHYIEAQ